MQWHDTPPPYPIDQAWIERKVREAEERVLTSLRAREQRRTAERIGFSLKETAEAFRQLGKRLNNASGSAANLADSMESVRQSLARITRRR